MLKIVMNVGGELSGDPTCSSTRRKLLSGIVASRGESGSRIVLKIAG